MNYFAVFNLVVFGFQFVTAPDECGRTGICGRNAICQDTPEAYTCTCRRGFRPTNPDEDLSTSNNCLDIDECVENRQICGPKSICTNTHGSYTCACQPGFTPTNSAKDPSSDNNCIDIDECVENRQICGAEFICTNTHGSYTCACQPGFTPANPDEKVINCVDKNECVENRQICGPESICTNTHASYTCACQTGFTPANPDEKPINCVDKDECVENRQICGPESICNNIRGSYTCACQTGFTPANPDEKPINCVDKDECVENRQICGPESICNNIRGSYTCACQTGFTPANPDEKVINCVDIDECGENRQICGPKSICTNTHGSYTCACQPGFTSANPDRDPSSYNNCVDIDECGETPGLCGPEGVCINVPGSFYCYCGDGYFPSTGVLWKLGVTTCQPVQDILDALDPPEGQTREMFFLIDLDKQLKENSDVSLPEAVVTNCFSTVTMVSGIGNQSEPAQTSSEGDGETGSVVLHISERLVSALVEPTQNRANRTIQTSAVDLSLQVIGPENSDEDSPLISTKGSTMEINLQALARNNNGSAAAAFMTVSGMENLLSHRYFQTQNKTEMYSDVITAVLPKTNNTKLSQPVNFTIQHKQKNESGLATCVYWEDKGEEKGAGRTRRWSVEGCWVAYSDENYTVCSCSHLSTFALIMQTGEPPPENPFLEWLNRVCVIIGLFFFALAILTFLLCSWNPKINNTARLHLCINLSLSHLLLLWNDRYVQYKLVCAVIAGLLHFLVIASFVWMLLEALQLHLLVQKLSKVKIIQRDGLPKPVLYLVGYGVPLVIVGVSASVNSGGYGGTELCWLSRDDYFNWALTGPVILMLTINLMLFCATLWCLRTTLANMKSNVSQSNDTRLILFKILAQFVILGCTWLIGLYQSNVFFQFLFIVLNSQQGTFLYIVHCLLNKEVREEYKKWLTCSSKSPSQEDSLKDASSDSEEFDKEEEEQTK